MLIELGGADDRRGFVEIIAGAITETVCGPFLVFVEPLHAVARAANLRTSNVIQICRLHDGQRFGPECRLAFRLGALGQALLPIDVSLGRAVAGFAGDAEVGHARLESLCRLIGARLWAGSMAADAVHVPVLLTEGRMRVADKQAAARCPSLVVDQPRERKADLQIALHAR